MDITSPKFTGLLATREVPLTVRAGLEAYYNFAITPWMKLTPDIQVVRGGQKDKLVSTIPPVKQSIDAATVVGLRLQLVF